MKAQITHWTAVRSVLAVAELGTLSAAAKALGLHHATVSRHIDSLEAELGIKLFQRHSHGYTTTEAGRELESISAGTRDQFSQFVNRLEKRSTDISGKLAITTISELTPLLIPWLKELHQRYPSLSIRLIADKRQLKLEYGEAHIAIRAGEKPTEPNNVVQLFCDVSLNLYAHPHYIARYGSPNHIDDFRHHHFVIAGNILNGSPLHAWMFEHIPERNIAFNSEEPALVNQALYEGMGIGIHLNHTLPPNIPLVPIMTSTVNLHSHLWLTTHGDLHRTEKVQTTLSFLKEKMNEHCQ